MEYTFIGGAGLLGVEFIRISITEALTAVFPKGAVISLPIHFVHRGRVIARHHLHNGACTEALQIHR